ncbi:MAG: hypothetical protein JSV21_00730 [Nitrospirota bacterium]|nr:MAG: hypothetical protein JSV21_00730 [Nitrospirota bacterium]
MFTDEDLEVYRKDNDKERPVSDVKAADKKIQSRQEEEYNYKYEQAQMNYWCKLGSKYEVKIERAKKDIELAEEHLNETEDDFRTLRNQQWRIRLAKKKLESAKLRLKRAEEDMYRIENDARRQSIPHGWLRCDFD